MFSRAGSGAACRVCFRSVQPERVKTPLGEVWRSVGIATAITLPGLLVRVGIIHPSVAVEAALFGASIMGAAFMLAWAAEVAQLDISQTLAIAVLAIVAVLPEYAVDLVLSYRAGQGTSDPGLAIANMTGANRLLIGIGWAAVVLVYWAKTRNKEVTLRKEQRTDVGYLLLASLWAATIPLRHSINYLDLAVLGLLFVGYIMRAAKEDVVEPELVGTPAAIATMATVPRRVTTIAMFLFAATAILVVAEPFAESLKDIGSEFGISQFLLIQWVAPLASEAPEMIIAILFVLRLKAQAGLGTLISSKVNQWTLLVATLPLVFSLGAGHLDGLPIDDRQREELFLTAAQSLFAVGVIANLSISRLEAVVLLVLFSAQLAIPITAVRVGFAVAYVVLFLGMIALRPGVRQGLWTAVRHVFRRTEESLPSR